MSGENVDVVRRALEEFPQRPEELADWLPQFWEPDADYYPVGKWLESRPCHGIAEIERFMAQFISAWDRWQLNSVRIAAIGPTCVLSLSNVVAEGRGSGLSLNGDLFQCSWLRRGRYLRVEDHLTWEGAARAFGLEVADLERLGLREASG